MKRIKEFINSIAASLLLISFTGCNFALPKNAKIVTSPSYTIHMGDLHFSKDKQHTLALSDFFSVDSIKEMMNGTTSSTDDSGVTTSFDIYDYNPEQKATVQNYLVDFNIGKNIDLDVSSYFENFDIDQMLASAGKQFEQEVEIPGFTSIPDYEIDLGAFVNDAWSDAVINMAQQNIPVSESVISEGTTTLTNIPIDATIAGLDFASMRFYDGSISIPFVRTSGEHSNSFNATIQFILKQKDGAESTAISSIPVELSSTSSASTNIVFDLTGKYLYPNMELSAVITCTSTGSASIVSYTLGSGGTISLDGTNPDLIEGLTIDDVDDKSFSNTANVSVGKMFVACKVAEGSIDVTAPMPEGWTGVSFVPSIVTAGSLETTAGDWVKGDEVNNLLDRSVSLENKYFNSVSEELRITFDGTIGITCENATIVLPNGEAPMITVSTKVDLSKIEWMIANLEDYASNLSVSVEQDVPEEFANYVEKVFLDKSGFKIEYQNNFPENNDIDLKVDSAFFNISSSTANGTGTMLSGLEEDAEPLEFLCETNETETGKNDEEITGYTLTPSTNGGKIDVAAQMVLPPVEVSESEYDIYKNNSNYAQINGISFGQKYKISASISPVFNWHYITLNTSFLNGMNQQSSMNLGINVKTLFKTVTDMMGEEMESFIQRVKFPSIPFYLSIQLPETEEFDLFKDVSFTGKVLVGNYDETKTYGEEGQDDYTDHIVTGTDKINIDISDLTNEDFVALEFAEDDPSMVINSEAIGEYDADRDLSKLIDFETEYPLGVYYSVGIDDLDAGLTIYKSDFDSLKESSIATSLGVSARIVLPIDLQIGPENSEEETNLDVRKILKNILASTSSEDSDSSEETDQEKDLFMRESASDLTSVSYFVNMVDSAWIKYKLDNSMFAYTENSKGLTVKMVMPSTDSEGNELTWSQENGEFTMDLTGSGTHDFKVSTQDVENMFSLYPFNPDILLVIPDGEIQMPRDAYVDLGVSLGVKLDAQIDIQELLGVTGGTGQ